MKKIIAIVSVFALSACASTNNSSPESVQAASLAKTTTVEAASSETSPDCEKLYTTYEAQMAQFKPKKKSFLQKSLGIAGAAAGNSIVGSKLIGSGMDPNTLGKVHNGIDTAQTLAGDNGISNLMTATSAVAASQQAYAYAGANGCDTDVLAKIAEDNT